MCDCFLWNWVKYVEGVFSFVIILYDIIIRVLGRYGDLIK